MKFNSNIGLKIHNRFDIQVKDASTGEVVQTAQAENIVLDRIYTRLLAFSSYFDQIVFGSGTGTLDPARTTLFNRVGNKAAVTESLVRSYPTSVLTKTIRLGTEEFNGNIIREVGISEITTNINTHALITDSEGNPLSVEKNNLRIIDIYATVFVEVYSVDTGCFFYANGLRDLLTGASAPANTIRLFEFSDETATTLTATRTSNSGERSISLAVRFNIEHFNKDVRFIDWVGGGLRWKIPRAGVYGGTVKTNVQLGTGDGSNQTFQLPNREVTSLTVMVDGVATSAYTRTVNDEIIFDTAPANGLLVSANYTTKYIPKDSDHVLDVSIKIQYAVNQPSPIESPPDFSSTPGPNTLIAGEEWLGYYGVTSAEDLISGDGLATLIGLTAGTSQFSDEGWLKYNNAGELTYVAKKAFRHTISWNHINDVNSVFGNRRVQIDNHIFIIRLLSTSEWDRLIYPIHASYGAWANFSDSDIQVASGNGRATWTSTPNSSQRIFRGDSSVENSAEVPPSTAHFSIGFRPVLVYLYTLPS